MFESIIHTKSTLSGLSSALKAAMRPKRGSSGAWGTTSAGKLVVEAIVFGERWLAMLFKRSEGEEVTSDWGVEAGFVGDGVELEGGMVGWQNVG